MVSFIVLFWTEFIQSQESQGFTYARTSTNLLMEKKVHVLLVCHQLVFEVTELPSEGGKHTVRNIQLLRSKKCRDSGTRTPITHRKNTATNYSRHPTERRETREALPEQPQVCRTVETNRLHQPFPNPCSVMEAPENGAAGGHGRRLSEPMLREGNKRPSTEAHRGNPFPPAPFSSEQPPPFKTPAHVGRAAPTANQRPR